MSNIAADIELRKLIKQYRVFYDQNERQASGHEDYFKDIQALGEYDVEHYRSTITIESRQKPWRQKTLSRAKVVSAKARRCLEANKNESSWRLGLESEIISRFSIEIVCSDEGLNPLFDDRAEEDIDYESEIENILKTGKRPDRLVGLRVTKRLERILEEAEGPDGEPVGNSIKTSPLKASCQPLLFPFLVLEAKSEKSSDMFSKIRLQTSFAIRALLNLQRNLALATNDNHQSAMKPLVWFLSSKGEIWRLSGAYVEETKDAAKPNYVSCSLGPGAHDTDGVQRILELWEGNITYERHSLRLLLILDYIFDWARDVYRKEIVSSLVSLSTNATPSLVAETDVFSTVGNLIDIGQMQEFDTDGINQEPHAFDVPHLLKYFDATDMSFRDAGYMRYTLCAIHVTLDDLDNFLDSVKTMREGWQLARKLWRALLSSSTWSVTASCLNAVETLWTGKDREMQTFSNPEDSYLVTFTVRSYLTGGGFLDAHNVNRTGVWDPIHELTYVAIAHDALEHLRDRTMFSTRSLPMRPEKCPRVPQEWVLAQFERFRLAPVKQSFTAAICRSTVRSESTRSLENMQPKFAAFANVRGRVVHYTPSLTRSEVFRPPNSAQLPWVVYRQLKVGRLEPSQSFLRISQQVSKRQSEIGITENSLWPKDNTGFFSACDSCLVAGVDTCDVNDLGKALSVRHCVFFFDSSPVTTRVADREQTNRLSSPNVLFTVLNIFSRSQQSCNMPLRFLAESELPVALKILNHVSKQYQLVLSLDSNPSDEDNRVRQKLSPRGFLEKWPFNFAQTVSGIKHVGDSYNFEQILQRLTAGFAKAIATHQALHRDSSEQCDSLGSITRSATPPPDRNPQDIDDKLMEFDWQTFLHAAASYRGAKSPKGRATDEGSGTSMSRKRKDELSDESERGRKTVSKTPKIHVVKNV